MPPDHPRWLTLLKRIWREPLQLQPWELKQPKFPLPLETCPFRPYLVRLLVGSHLPVENPGYGRDE